MVVGLSAGGAGEEVGDPVVEVGQNGKTLATGSSDKTVILWDLTNPSSPRRLGQPLSNQMNEVFAVAFSPDGRILATGSGNVVILWDFTNSTQPRLLGQPLTGDSGTVWSMAFSPVGKTLATGSNYTAILWDLTDPTQPRRLGQPLTDHRGTVSSVAFSRDGQTLATGSYDSTATLWNLADLNDLRNHATERACAITGRGLDRDEWARYIPGLAYQDTCPA